MIGFFEEAADVRSMTRLIIFWLGILTSAVVGAAVWYVVRRPDPSAAVLGALAGIIAALVANGIVAIVKRSGGES